MKEEAPNMLPPKIVSVVLPTNNIINNNNNSNSANTSSTTTQGAPTATTTTTQTNKIANDEILSTLLRINNFDSISSIKDESLDIDLSACVTINPAGIINCNSLSSSDFWRVLDESAQIPEKEGAPNASIKSEVKEELPSSFSGTFLRPEPPSVAISPIKKLVKSKPTCTGEQKRRKIKTAGKTSLKIDNMTNGGCNTSTLSSPPPTMFIKKEATDCFTFENVNDNGNSLSDLNDFKPGELKIEDSPKHKMSSLPSFSEIHNIQQQQQQQQQQQVSKNTDRVNGAVTPASATSNIIAFSQTVDLSQIINMGQVNGPTNINTSVNLNGSNNNDNHRLSAQQQQQFKNSAAQSSDFWCVLDESAQIPEKEAVPNASIKSEVKEELPSSFSGTFLRPEPPSIGVSPMKKLAKNKHACTGEQKRRKLKTTNGKIPFKIDNVTNGGSNTSTLSSPPPAMFIKKEISDCFPFENVNDNVNSLSDLNDFKAEDCQIEDGLTHNMISLPSFSEIHNMQQQVAKNSERGNGAANPAGATSNIIPFSQTVDLNQIIKIGQNNGSNNLNTSVTTLNASNNNNNQRLPAQQQQLQFKNAESQDQEATQPKQQVAGGDASLAYKCTECEQEFELESAMKKHLKTHRNTADGRKDAWKKCPDCGKCLKLGSMWMHRKIHSDNRKYECDVCGQKFVQKINLTHHARIHTSEKPYECPECQKRFQERSHLQRHQKYHAQTRSYRCDKCGKMYKTERCLKVHNLVHLERRPFACTVCDKSFISNSKLKQHLNIHTGARPFKCNYCPRDFTNFPNWLKHTRRRHKVDHKTGEQLENIPSYCSKKSSASAAATTTAGARTATAGGSTNAVATSSGGGGSLTAANSNAATKPTHSQQQQQLIIKALDSINSGMPANDLAENVKLLAKSIKVKNGTVKPPTVRRKRKPATVQQIDKKGGNSQALMSASQKSSELITNVLIGVDDNAINATPKKMSPNSVVATTVGSISLIQTPTAPILTKSTNSLAVIAGTLANKQHNHSSSSNNNNGNNKLTNGNHAGTTTTALNALPKVKRERKQLSPKQVRLDIVSQLSPIKTETDELERKQLITNFLDLHCLSLTSAEELIMEQALEMEECGLYDAPVSAVYN